MSAVHVPGGGWVDHIVWGAPDTDAAAEELADLTGVRPRPASTARGTDYPTYSNGVSLGGERFFEIYGPNPVYDGEPHPMHELLRSLSGPRLLVWFARVADLVAAGAALEATGRMFRPMIDEWERTDAASFRNGHLADHALDPSVPYLIEWRDRLDMETRMASGLDLLGLTAVATDPGSTAAVHGILGIEVPIVAGEVDGFRIRLGTPRGVVEL